MGTRTTGTENTVPTSQRRPPPPPWIELPGDLTANILQRLGAEEILKSAEKLCTTWFKLCLDPAMWRVVALKNSSDDRRGFDAMCRCAVDRSHGQLIDLSITGFGDNELLNYVAHRSSHLRRLTLADPVFDISAPALIEAVKKLPLLEELHLIAISPVLGAEDVEAISISCPLLSSFSYEEVYWCCSDTEEYKCNGNVALAVANTMPNLHHLRIGGDRIMKNDEVLEAILDGCPHLQSLDVSGCCSFHDLISGALRERCSKQIKFLRLPYDFGNCFHAGLDLSYNFVDNEYVDDEDYYSLHSTIPI